MRYRFRPLFIAALFFLIAGCAFDGQTMDLRDIVRSASPNDALACPPGICRAQADFETPVFAVGQTRLTDIARATFKNQPRTELVGGDPALDQLVFVQRSRLFGFPDTIRVQGATVGARASVIIYSRSNYGYWDFGVNRARVRDWLDMLVRAVKRDRARNPG